MKRKTFDLILTAVGALLVVVLAAAGALLLWGASWTNSNVRNQLEKQQITFPPASAFAHAKAGTEITPTMRQYLLPYAGQQLLTGTQAEAYADHFIAVHLYDMPYHGVYSQVSAAARAHPTTAKLQGLVQTTFQGTTLRGLLLEAYAFSTFGRLAFDGALGAFGAGFVMLILTSAGVWHLRRVPVTEEFPKSVGTGVSTRTA